LHGNLRDFLVDEEWYLYVRNGLKLAVGEGGYQWIHLIAKK